ncbi:hypothetical protein AVEN_185959-1 [Araneus ventricosus]|uniref:Uncharacterized protein n=1 Tax=Araneus ventricosus TaxID=182803 RepID=A0A4Y2LDR3_ARAVE|nr:hypothetical protein AVEN_185959-1 [Araneus ventricosus]
MNDNNNNFITATRCTTWTTPQDTIHCRQAKTLRQQQDKKGIQLGELFRNAHDAAELILNLNHDAVESVNPIPTHESDCGFINPILRIHGSNYVDSRIRICGFMNPNPRIRSFWSDSDPVVPFEEPDPRIRSGVNNTSLMRYENLNVTILQKLKVLRLDC